jgi:hypothetical protein
MEQTFLGVRSKRDDYGVEQLKYYHYDASMLAPLGCEEIY